MDFADLRRYHAETSKGIVVLRLKRQDKPFLLPVLERMCAVLEQESPIGKCGSSTRRRSGFVTETPLPFGIRERWKEG